MGQAKLKIGLYGSNGHQIIGKLNDHPEAELAAVAAVDASYVPEPLRETVRIYDTLEELLASDVELVSLCSPLRSEQAVQAVACLEAGKHVYAEKPSAMREDDLDRIMEASARTGKAFHEMSETIHQQPYAEMRRLVRAGAIGEVVQVFSQKSYPYGDWRPQNEDVDGGLLLQVGVYNMRFAEQLAGQRIVSAEAAETKLGNDTPAGECRRAVSFMMRLANGGIATGIANYLVPKPPALPKWGYEIVRIFGTDGFVESIDLGSRTRLISGGQDCGELAPAGPELRDFDVYVSHLKYGTPMPLTMEEELHPTRMAVRARERLRVFSANG